MSPLQSDECPGPATARPRALADEESIAWLNVVPDGRDTGYHDHDGSAVHA